MAELSALFCVCWGFETHPFVRDDKQEYDQVRESKLL